MSLMLSAKIEDPAERVRLAFKLFDSEGVALVNLLRDGSDGLDEMRERARDLGIVLDESLVRDAEAGSDGAGHALAGDLGEPDPRGPECSAGDRRSVELAGRLVRQGRHRVGATCSTSRRTRAFRTLRYELDLTSSTIEKLQGRIQQLQDSSMLGFTTVIDAAQISVLQDRIDQLSRARDQIQARIAFLDGPPNFLDGPPKTSAPTPLPSSVGNDTGDVTDNAKKLEQIARRLETQLFNVTHEGSEKIIAEHARRVAEIEALRSRDGSNAEDIDRLDLAVSVGSRGTAIAASGQGSRRCRKGAFCQRGRRPQPGS